MNRPIAWSPNLRDLQRFALIRMDIKIRAKPLGKVIRCNTCSGVTIGKFFWVLLLFYFIFLIFF